MGLGDDGEVACDLARGRKSGGTSHRDLAERIKRVRGGKEEMPILRKGGKEMESNQCDNGGVRERTGRGRHFVRGMSWLSDGRTLPQFKSLLKTSDHTGRLWPADEQRHAGARQGSWEIAFAACYKILIRADLF
ncbi:Hypothetical protein SMAX5B_000175 [Scophthalmus maximus]|uniref:Uncharacterized protein n=1 Tax=Scophthalmus maximus TaxID=52904 RepID=A0A2U9CUS1_SCOMX|nr:Hypothetical protein SMAX5B_000175 [Scophthalmus maximus]